jgi:predicted porin
VAELEATAARKGQRKVDLKLTGKVSRALLFWDDGRERNTYVVDNDFDSTDVHFEGEAKIGKGSKAGFEIDINVLSATSDKVDQLVDNPGGVFDLSDAYFFIENERLGKVRVGLNDSATDKVDNLQLAEADVAADNGPQSWNESFFLRAGTGELLTGVRWDDFFPSDIGGSDNLVTYISPEIMGFEASVAWGKDDFWDVALRYKGEWAKAIEVQAAIGYARDMTEGHSAAVFDPVAGRQIGDKPIVEDSHWAAGLALKHKPTGLNIAVNYSREEHTDDCQKIASVPGGQHAVSDRGVVSGECRGPDEFVYVIGGIIRDLLPSLGRTAFYGEYFWGQRERNESDTAKLAALQLNVTQPAQELKESVVTVWGFGVVQKINDEPKKKGDSAKPVIELYLGYKHFELDVDLIANSLAGPISVPSKKIEDFDVIGAGITIKF